jgi:hypothetical protein
MLLGAGHNGLSASSLAVLAWARMLNVIYDTNDFLI